MPSDLRCTQRYHKLGCLDIAHLVVKAKLNSTESTCTIDEALVDYIQPITGLIMQVFERHLYADSEGSVVTRDA